LAGLAEGAEGRKRWE